MLGPTGFGRVVVWCLRVRFARVATSCRTGTFCRSKNIGVLYNKGRGVSKGFRSAFEKYRGAVEQGNLMPKFRCVGKVPGGERCISICIGRYVVYHCLVKCRLVRNERERLLRN